jgi:hypothetical protein
MNETRKIEDPWLLGHSRLAGDKARQDSLDYPIA